MGITRPHRRAAAVAATTAAVAALLTTPAHAVETVRIHDVQGDTRVSPLAGKTVTDLPGVVTGVRTYGSSKGFWVQDPTPDRNAATSEGLFVFTDSVPKVKPGDAVLLTGRVTEYYPGGIATGVQSLTQLSKPAVTVVSSGNPVPAPVELNMWTVPSNYAPDGDLEKLVLQPQRYALDRYEALEGMNVQVDDAAVVGPSNDHAELWVTVKPWQNPTRRGGTVYGSYEARNAGRIKIQSLVPLAQQPFPKADVGDVLTGASVGPLDYNQFGGYTLTATQLGTLRSGDLKREVTRTQESGELAIATYNVENLDPTDPQAKFDQLAAAVVSNLASPDILALEEIQDDNGKTDDGTVSAELTLRKFADAIVAAGGPRYAWRSIAPQDKKDGGEPGGNIRTAFLFNPLRVSFTDKPGGDAVTPVGVTPSAGLTLSPGRIDPLNEAWTDSRKPLAGEFVFRGCTVIVVANHFNSKGGDQPLDARVQQPSRSSEVQRLKQATAVNGFVKNVVAADPKAAVVVLGDVNDFTFSPTVAKLTDGGVLRDLANSLPSYERYSYVYNGNSQLLDHILASPGVKQAEYDIVHINAEFAAQASDHDPQIVRLKP